MSKTIFLCASMAFYRELVEIEKKLDERGFTVKIPISAQVMKEKHDFEVSHFKDAFTHGEKSEFIHKNFQEITSSDSILVINDEKNGIKGYIGANVLMEIGIAFYFKKKIYIWNDVEQGAPYREELNAFDVKFINQNISSIS